MKKVREASRQSTLRKLFVNIISFYFFYSSPNNSQINGDFLYSLAKKVLQKYRNLLKIKYLIVRLYPLFVLGKAGIIPAASYAGIYAALNIGTETIADNDTAGKFKLGNLFKAAVKVFLCRLVITNLLGNKNLFEVMAYA